MQGLDPSFTSTLGNARLHGAIPGVAALALTLHHALSVASLRSEIEELRENVIPGLEWIAPPHDVIETYESRLRARVAELARLEGWGP